MLVSAETDATESRLACVVVFAFHQLSGLVVECPLTDTDWEVVEAVPACEGHMLQCSGCDAQVGL